MFLMFRKQVLCVPMVPSLHVLGHTSLDKLDVQNRHLPSPCLCPDSLCLQSASKCRLNRQSFVVQLLCPTLCNPMNCSPPGSPVFHCLQEFAQICSTESMMLPNYLILCYPLLSPSIFPRIRVVSNESALRIGWPKYWSFSFSISPSNECSGLISFRVDWFDLAV